MSRRNHKTEDRRPAFVADAAPSSAAVPELEKREPQQQFLVRVENLTRQVLEVSVLDEGGAVTGVRLDPRGKSRPIPTDQVGQRTHDLVARGLVRIVPQS